jgi:hypothetical protein
VQTLLCCEICAGYGVSTDAAPPHDSSGTCAGYDFKRDAAYTQFGANSVPGMCQRVMQRIHTIQREFCAGDVAKRDAAHTHNSARVLCRGCGKEGCSAYTQFSANSVPGMWQRGMQRMHTIRREFCAGDVAKRDAAHACTVHASVRLGTTG